MSNLLDKSKENRSAAAFLKDRRVYAPVVHCCYYSCFQKIKYILQEYYTQQYLDEEKLRRGGKGTLHNNMIVLFSSLYSKEYKEQRNLRNKLIELKKLRIESDYEDIKISDKKLDIVENYTNEIHRLIKKNCKL